MPEEIYDPRERLEIFLNAIRTGNVDDLPDPQTREEMYLAAIAGKSALPDTTDASVGDTLMLNNEKIPEWGTSAKHYLHYIYIKITESSVDMKCAFTLITSDSTAFTSKSALYDYINNHIMHNSSGEVFLTANATSVNNVMKMVTFFRLGTSSPGIRYNTVNLSDGTSSGFVNTTSWDIIGDYVYDI